MPMIARSYSPSAVGQHETTMGWFDLFNEVGAVVMTISIVAIQPLVALIAGILILLIPRILNFVVAIYLILIGVLGLWPHLVHWSIKLAGLAVRNLAAHIDGNNPTSAPRQTKRRSKSLRRWVNEQNTADSMPRMATTTLRAIDGIIGV
jgi:hypothetical protein